MNAQKKGFRIVLLEIARLHRFKHYIWELEITLVNLKFFEKKCIIHLVELVELFPKIGVRDLCPLVGAVTPKVAFFLDYTKLRDHIAPPFLKLSTNGFLLWIGK